MKNKKHVLIGAIGSGSLLSLYLVVLGVAGSLNHVIEQFVSMWYWIVLLAGGFGFQLGLYSFIRTGLKQKSRASTAEVAASGGLSTGAMIACCAHHLADVLPLLGLTAASLFLVRYQLPFILLGVLSNLVGITMMLAIIQKHGLRLEQRFIKWLLSFNQAKVRTAILIFSAVILPASFLLVSVRAGAKDQVADANRGFILEPLVNDQNSVTVEVEPLDFRLDEPVRFRLSFNTHQGDLDFDLTKISLLEDDQGNTFQPLRWEGSPPGGHHRKGILVFPELKAQTKRIKLTIRDVYDVPKRVFEWKLL
jgi:hypothetical protein